MGSTYESLGDARIVVTHSSDGVGIVANRDGLLSLARLFADLTDSEWDHIHLTPTMQLPPSSEPLVIAVKPTDHLPQIAGSA
ncbi:MAG: hypothetical protein GY698_07125 [Actinomycetia bacterium]|nr:hypothetical protein [Actinomycetes bacterium]